MSIALLGARPETGRATTSAPEAARLPGIDVRTVRARIKRGEIAGGAVSTTQRMRWFVYADALPARLVSHERPFDRSTPTARDALMEVSRLLAAAQTALGAALQDNRDGLVDLDRTRSQWVAQEIGTADSLTSVRAAVTLLSQSLPGTGAQNVLAAAQFTSEREEGVEEDNL